MKSPCQLHLWLRLAQRYLGVHERQGPAGRPARAKPYRDVLQVNVVPKECACGAHKHWGPDGPAVGVVHDCFNSQQSLIHALRSGRNVPSHHRDLRRLSAVEMPNLPRLVARTRSATTTQSVDRTAARPVSKNTPELLETRLPAGEAQRVENGPRKAPIGLGGHKKAPVIMRFTQQSQGPRSRADWN